MIYLNWTERCIKTEDYHIAKCRLNPKHTIRDTANELQRSYGSVNEDLQLASWMRTHPRLEFYKRMNEALAFIRNRKLQSKRRDG